MATYKTVPMWVVTLISEARSFDREDVPMVYNYFFNDRKDAEERYKILTTHHTHGIAEILRQRDDRGGRFTRFATKTGLIETVWIKMERIAVKD